jgi:hypothetical protein
MSDTAALDQKNEELNNTTNTEEPSYASKVVTFVTQTLVLCLAIIIYYGFSGALLYSCKLGQSNILPTESKCEPYTEYKPTIQEKQTNIFTDTFINPQNSMKLTFPLDKFNLSNKLLDMFRDYKNEPESNFLANYFISIAEALIQFFYICMNFTLNMMNQLPEALIVLFGIPIVSIISTIVLIISNFYILFLWFANMKWFFKSNENNKHGPPKWEDVPLISFKYFIACCLVFTFLIIFFIAFGFFPFITSILSLYCGISCLSYKSLLNGTNAGVFTVIQDVFKYYKVTIMFVFSIIVVSTAFSKLGPLPGVFSLITLGLIYFGLVGLSIYKPINKDHLSPVTDYEQAVKTCKVTNIEKNKSWLEMIGMKGGGKNITKQLKDIHKKFTKSNSNM